MAETNTSPELIAANKLIADLSLRLAALEAAGKVVPAAPGTPVPYKPSAKKPYKKVLYHGNYVQPTIMNVLDENGDGTVNIGLNDAIVVRKVTVLKEIKPGYATAGTDVPAPAKDESDE
jgi:hypothetical protein